MDANLMRPSSFRDRPHDGEGFFVVPSEPALDSEIGPCFGARWMDYLLKPDSGRYVFALSRKGGVHGNLVPLRRSPYDREILLGDAVFLHQQSETASRRGIFRDQDEATRFAIETVDDRDLSAVGDFISEKLL